MSLAPPWNHLRWEAADRFSVGDMTFDLVNWGGPRKQGSPDCMVLVKDASFAGSMARILSGHRIDAMVEIGVYQGGGLALFDQLYAPGRLLGIDDRPTVPDALARYVADRGAADRIAAVPGVDQADAARLSGLLDRYFPDRTVDLAIDDASHLYGPTRTAFEVVFPYLRPGGIYLIEDWGWAHWRDVFEGTPPFQGPPLSRLVMELIMVQAAAPELIARIDVDWHHAAVVRGTGAIEGRFCLTDHMNRRLTLNDRDAAGHGGVSS